MVLFSKGKCLVMDESRKKLISGVRTLNNCDGLVPDANIVCNSICLPNEDIWHQRMGHASYKHLSIVSKHELVLGIPNSYTESFCMRSGISQEFFALITPQQSGVVERNNKVIQEMAKAMLHNKDVARNLWEEAL